MQRRRIPRLTGLVLVSGLVGYLIGPPIVQAASNLVTIKDSVTNQKARVVKGNLWVDAGGSTVFTLPFGMEVIAAGTAPATNVGGGRGVLTAVVAGNTGVTITADTDCNGTGGDALWKNAGAGHFSDTFESGVFYCGPLDVAAATEQWVLYGVTFTSSASPSGREARTTFIDRVREMVAR